MTNLRSIRVPGFDFDVPIVIDFACEHRGVVKYEGFQNRPVVYLREWDERVLLHEVFHVLVASWRHTHQRDAEFEPGSEREERFVRHLTYLHDLGWRFCAAP
jgi:hypothetical protein